MFYMNIIDSKIYKKNFILEKKNNNDFTYTIY